MPKPNVADIFGKIKVVDSFPDFKVKIVESFPDLKVKRVVLATNSIFKILSVD